MKYFILAFITLSLGKLTAQLQLTKQIEYRRNALNVIVDRDSLNYFYNSSMFNMDNNMPFFDVTSYVPQIFEPINKDFSYASRSRYFINQFYPNYTFGGSSTRNLNADGSTLKDSLNNTNGSNVLIYKTMNTYDANGNVILIKNYSLVSAVWVLNDSTVKAYSASNKLQVTHTFELVNALLSLTAIDSVKYDANDRAVQHLNYQVDLQTLNLSLANKSVIFYNNNVVDSAYIYYANLGDPLVLSQLCTYEYSSGNLTSFKTFFYDSPGVPIPSDVTNFTYNGNNNVNKITYVYSGDTTNNYYNYFQPNFVSTVTMDNTPATVFRKFEYRSTASLAASSLSQGFICYPNPGNSVLSVAIENVSDIVMLDQSGRVVLQQNGNNSSVNVTQLSKGMYTIQVLTQDGSLFQSKWMKE